MFSQGGFSLIESVMDETTGDRVDASGQHDKDMEHIMGSLPSDEIPPELQNCNVEYNALLTYIPLLQQNCSTPYKFPGGIVMRK